VTSNRKIALAAGVLFIITFITSIPALYLFEPVLRDPAGYIAGSGADNTRIFLGATLELLLIVANVASAVVRFRSSGGRTKCLRSALSPHVSLRARSSPSASSACSAL
jgi:hypothetical protein